MRKSIVESKKVDHADLETSENHSERVAYLPDRKVSITFFATGVYSSLYCSTSTPPLSGILACLPSGNLVFLASSVQGGIFIDQIIGDIYTYHQINKLFISMDNIDHETASDLPRFLRDED